jgi:hypothetical protein
MTNDDEPITVSEAAMSLTSLASLQIFRAGAYPQGEFTVADLERIALSYDPAWHEAPCCITHEAEPGGNLSAEAYGWVKRLWVAGDVLMADVDEVPAEFAAAVEQGRFKKRSAGIYTALRLRDGSTGPYLRHVAWVPIPQVKGLADPMPAKASHGRPPTFEDQSHWSFVPCHLSLVPRTHSNCMGEGPGTRDEGQALPRPDATLTLQEDPMIETVTPTAPPGEPPVTPTTPSAPNEGADRAATAPAAATRVPVLPTEEADIAARVDRIVREAAGKVVEEFRRKSARATRLDGLAAFFAEMVRQGRVSPAQAVVEQRALERIAGAAEFAEGDAELIEAKQREIRCRPPMGLFAEHGRRGLSAAVAEPAGANDAGIAESVAPGPLSLVLGHRSFGNDEPSRADSLE